MAVNSEKQDETKQLFTLEDFIDKQSRIFDEALEKNKARTKQTNAVIDEYEKQKQFMNTLPTELKKTVLVPVGTKAFFRGNLIHTNEVYQKIGCGYLVKKTIKQAVETCNRYVEDSKRFLQELEKEKNWLEGKMHLPMKENIFSELGQKEIIEEYNEEEEAKWRIRHRESIKTMKQAEAQGRKDNLITDEELFNRLDVLEMEEELERSELEREKANRKKQIDKELEEIRNQKTVIKTEDDIMKRLDELEKEEELLEEMEMMEDEDDDDDDDDADEKKTSDSETPEHTQIIKFSDNVKCKVYDINSKVESLNQSDDVPSKEETEHETGDSETLFLEFSHSDVKPSFKIKNSDSIETPGDIYEFLSKPKSILKNKDKSKILTVPEDIEVVHNIKNVKSKSAKLKTVHVFTEVQETSEPSVTVIKSDKRPESRFKASKRAKK